MTRQAVGYVVTVYVKDEEHLFTFSRVYRTPVEAMIAVESDLYDIFHEESNTPEGNANYGTWLCESGDHNPLIPWMTYTMYFDDAGREYHITRVFMEV